MANNEELCSVGSKLRKLFANQVLMDTGQDCGCCQEMANLKPHRITFHPIQRIKIMNKTFEIYLKRNKITGVLAVCSSSLLRPDFDFTTSRPSSVRLLGDVDKRSQI